MPATARKHRVAAPARAGRRPTHAASTAPATLDPIITMNAAGVIQSASDSVEQVFGWKPSELFGRNISVFIPEPRRSDLDRYLDRYRRASRSGARTRTGQFDAVHKNGTIFPIELSMSRADLPTHSAPFFVGIIRDITHKIDLQNAPEEDRSRLQNLVTEQTRALATANLRLQLADRLASLGTLAAGLGHDMNNVLLPLRARIHALESSRLTAAAQGHVAALRGSIDYLQQLSDGLHYLSLDPADLNVTSEHEGSTDLGEWWNQVGMLLRKAVPRHVELRASIPRGLPPATVASHWLTQAALNLIVNAGESIPVRRNGAKGIVRISAKTAPDGSVRLTVSDNGRGMTPEVRRRAFDLFFTTKMRGMGTGLGLPLVQRVASRAGGRVELTSHAGKGTTATLILPPAAPRAGASPANRLTAVVSAREVRTAALIMQILRGAGLSLVAAIDSGPGRSDIWVTEPTGAALSAAKRWRKRHPRRAIILLRPPTGRSRTGWAALHPTILEKPDDFECIRAAVARATTHAGKAAA